MNTHYDKLDEWLKYFCGVEMADLTGGPTTMFELYQRELSRKPTQEEVDQFRKNKEEMEPWRFYHWYWNIGDNKYEIGDIVTRDGTDEHVIEEIDYDYMLIGVRCLKEPWHEEGEEPWTHVGEHESNLIRRYSLVRKHGKPPSPLISYEIRQ